MNQENKTTADKSSPGRLGTHVVLVLIGFLVGFIPMWWKAHQCSGQLSETMDRIQLAKLQIAVSTAVIDAKRGEYESARQAISDFFTSLRKEIDRAEGSFFSKVQRDSLALLFSKRDEIVTLLARSDAAGSEPLMELYVSFSKVLGKKQGEISPGK
jgi:hypothetical protein